MARKNPRRNIARIEVPGEGRIIYGGWEDAHRSFTTWERFATFWDPPIPATMKPLTLICVFLIAVQTVNNLIIDWKNPKEKQYDPSKDLK